MYLVQNTISDRNAERFDDRNDKVLFQLRDVPRIESGAGGRERGAPPGAEASAVTSAFR